MNLDRILALSVISLASVAMSASLAGAMTPDSVDGPTVESGPPVLRVSDVLSNGSARLDRVNRAYTDCLIEAGTPTLDPSAGPVAVPAASISAKHGLILSWPPSDAAAAACVDLEPVYPPALDASTNPTFAAQAQTYVACLESQGEFVRLLNTDDLDWTYRAGHEVPDDIARIEDTCLVDTFGSE